jgi:PRA1 family protein
VIYEKIRNRIEQNGAYYLSNYALIAAMAAFVMLLLHPNVIFTFALLSALWWFHGYLIRHEVVVASLRVHEVFPVQHRFYILFLQSCFLILVTCLIPTVRFILISGSIILCHATFRDTSHLLSEQDDAESPRQHRKVSFQMEELDP